LSGVDESGSLTMDGKREIPSGRLDDTNADMVVDTRRKVKSSTKCGLWLLVVLFVIDLFERIEC
jgi:hypothetical protein